jgi:hypothetical protein
MLHIDHDTWKTLPLDLVAAVAAFKAEVDAHSLTVGVPAPTAPHPLVEHIVSVHGGEFELEPEPEPAPLPPISTVPQSITRRQCARQLFESQMITGPEMVAMTATGTPPAMIEQIFSQMPEEAQWIARADFAADTYHRTNPLLVSVMQASGATSADIDNFFREAGSR